MYLVQSESSSQILFYLLYISQSPRLTLYGNSTDCRVSVVIGRRWLIFGNLSLEIGNWSQGPWNLDLSPHTPGLYNQKILSSKDILIHHSPLFQQRSPFKILNFLIKTFSLFQFLSQEDFSSLQSWVEVNNKYIVKKIVLFLDWIFMEKIRVATQPILSLELVLGGEKVRVKKYSIPPTLTMIEGQTKEVELWHHLTV